jgi:hypothetical protein
LAALGRENGDDLIGDLDLFLAEATWELIGLELLEDFLEWQIYEGVVAVRSVGKDTRGRGFAELAEGDADGAMV